MSTRRWFRTAVIVLVVGLLYMAGAEAAWRVFGAAELGLAFFPPAGVTVAALLLLPGRSWPAVLAVVVAVEVIVDIEHGLTLPIALGYALANVVEPVVGAVVTRSVLHRPRPGWASRDGFWRFVLGAVGVGPMVGGVVGGWVRVVDTGAGWLSASVHWWAGDAVAVLAVGFPILVLSEARRGGIRFSSEGVLALVTAIAVGVLAFWVWTVPPSFLVLPLLVWVAVRFTVTGVAVTGFVLAVIANAATATGRGPFAALDMSAQARIGMIQLFLISMLLAGWFLAIETQGRTDATRELVVEQVARARSDALVAVGELSRRVVGEVSVDSIAMVVWAQVSERFAASVVGVVLYDPVADRFRALPSSLPSRVLDRVAEWTLDTATPGPHATTTGEPVWIASRDDLLARFPEYEEIVVSLDLHAVAAVPLPGGPDRRGYLFVGRGQDDAFTSGERVELHALAQIVADALHRGELYDAERRSRIAAEDARMQLTVLMVKMERDAERLQESEIRFRTMSDQLPVLVWQHDCEGRQIWVNDTFCRYFAVTRDEMVDSSWSLLTHPDDGEAYVASFEHAVRTRASFTGTVRVRNGDGRWCWIESWAEPLFASSGEFLGHLGSSIDVTARRAAEEQTRSTLAFLDNVTSVVPGVVYLFDLDEARPTFVSRSAGEALGYEAGELGAGFFTHVLHPDDIERARNHRRFVATLPEGETASIEYRFQHLDGSWRWYLDTHVVAARRPDGTAQAVAGLAIDITDRHLAQAALRAEAELGAFRSHLSDALRHIADSATVQAIAAQALTDHLTAASVHYAEFDDRGGYNTLPPGDHPSVPGDRVDEFDPGVMTELRAGRRVIVEDIGADPRSANLGPSTIATTESGAYAITPIVSNGQLVGALVVCHDHPHKWSDHDLRALDETAQRTWAVVAQTRADAALRQRRARDEFAADLLIDLEAQPTPEACYERLVDALIPGLADYATVEVPDSDEYLLAAAHLDSQKLETLRTLRVHHRIDADEANPSQRSAGEAQLVSVVTPAVKAEHASTPEVADLVARLGTRSHMSVPLDLGARTTGVLTVGLVDLNRPSYSNDDLGFLTDLARRVSIVLAASRVRDAEHSAALRLQQALLPDAIIWHPDIVIEARYHAASELLEVGGDWYDTFMWPCGRIGLMVGDVVGHDLESAAAMGRLRAATAALASHLGPDPAVLLDALDRFARSVDGTSFATAVCVIVDPATGLLTYSSAGHPPVIVIAPDATVTRLHEAQSPPLCALSTSARTSASITLEPGSLVVMYSDGLIERRCERLDHGIGRLERSAIRHLNDPIDECTDQIVADMTTHSAPSDDVVVACFRFTPASARFEAQLPAQAEQQAVLRAAMRVWAAGQRVAGKPLNDLLLGVGEAVSNAIDHAYRDNDDGVVAIDISNHLTHLVARIVDNGRWRPPGPHSQNRGRGLSIMEAVASHYERVTNNNGSTVTMSFPQTIPARAYQP